MQHSLGRCEFQISAAASKFTHFYLLSRPLLLLQSDAGQAYIGHPLLPPAGPMNNPLPHSPTSSPARAIVTELEAGDAREPRGRSQQAQELEWYR